MEQDVKYLGVPNICFSLTDKDDKREKGFHKQRVSRGFDDSETWSLDSTICRFVLPRLRVFRNKHTGYPMSLTEKKWDKILDKMILAFELIEKDERGESITAEEQQQINKGFDLFHKWFFSLWW